MKKILFLTIIYLSFFTSLSHAEPTAGELRDTIRKYISQQEKQLGIFAILDRNDGSIRPLELVGVHERVGKTGNFYYSCTDMRDLETGELRDLDFDISDEGGILRVVSVRIHKDDGIPRYTYGDKDELMPVTVLPIFPTQTAGKLSGRISFMDSDEGLRVNAVIKGLDEGQYAFHVHENGSCEDAGNAAGSHFNPDGNPHGSVENDGLHGAHAGDLGNIEVDANGKGVYGKIIPGLKYEGGAYGIKGRAIVIHERADDFSQPAGNAGERIGCAVLE